MVLETMDREIILVLPDDKNITSKIIQTAIENNINSFFCDPELIDNTIRRKVKVYSSSDKGDVILLDSLQKAVDVNKMGKEFALKIKITQKADESIVVNASEQGAMGVFIETEDWKIIPLENLVAQLHKKDTKLFAKIDFLEEIQTMFGVLELGVDGIIYTPKSPDDLKSLLSLLSLPKSLELVPVKITEVKDIGMGDRACIDTASMLEIDDGALIGSQSSFFFLIRSEAIASKFSAPRPFRINAGAVHSYILLADASTKYLSEIEAGDEVLIVNSKGITKSAIVGRSKIERRPLRLLKAIYNNLKASILVQNAETIRLAGKKGELISATEIKPNDEVLAYVQEVTGRHFGIQVNEHILEK
ncbi:MAG: 3-dehydroquinate synthase II [Candidatus Methylarchaceae archaeon HK02M2]|nr:3-dehydroquinate synthase II [Candidatus Methylarchaceae archaeon HK02M2]